MERTNEHDGLGQGSLLALSFRIDLKVSTLLIEMKLIALVELYSKDRNLFLLR
jgi:hypothetical protein